MRLKDRIAIVTGGGRGIGRDIVLAYAKEGAHVVVNDVDPATSEATAAEAARGGTKCIGVVADIASSADIARLIDSAIDAFGRIDILVNNAMKIVPGKLEELPEAAWDTTMNIGLKGAFLASQGAARHMIRQKSGAIVNIASVAGLFPYNWAGSYSVVKAGLIMLTKLRRWSGRLTASAPTPSRPATSARPAPRRCTPTPRSTRAAARASRWGGSAAARTLRVPPFPGIGRVTIHDRQHSRRGWRTGRRLFPFGARPPLLRRTDRLTQAAFDLQSAASPRARGEVDRRRAAMAVG